MDSNRNIYMRSRWKKEIHRKKRPAHSSRRNEIKWAEFWLNPHLSRQSICVYRAALGALLSLSLSLFRWAPIWKGGIKKMWYKPYVEKHTKPSKKPDDGENESHSTRDRDGCAVRRRKVNFGRKIIIISNWFALWKSKSVSFSLNAKCFIFWFR